MAMVIGFIIDLIVGDPRGIPHIVVLMGRLIALLETVLRRIFPDTPRGRRAAGGVLVLLMALFAVCVGLLLRLVYRAGFIPGLICESLLCWQLIAVKDLRIESMAVCERLEAGDLAGARQAVSMIVGRDTGVLDEAGVARAAVETVAENTSDGIVAPLLYMAIGGAPLACLYKAVNTMDSMVGYKNERYLDFGRMAAKTDDIMNWIPSRLAALLMILAAGFTGMDAAGARRIWLRDRRRHASPNSAQTESVCAGALGLRLAGDAYYFGELHRKEYIGDDIRPIEPADIGRANRLTLVTSVLCLLFCLLLRTGLRALLGLGWL